MFTGSAERRIAISLAIALLQKPWTTASGEAGGEQLPVDVHGRAVQVPRATAADAAGDDVHQRSRPIRRGVRIAEGNLQHFDREAEEDVQDLLSEGAARATRCVHPGSGQRRILAREPEEEKETATVAVTIVVEDGVQCK